MTTRQDAPGERTRSRAAGRANQKASRRRDPADEDRLYVLALLDRPVPAPRVPGHRIEILELRGVFAAIERMVEAPRISERALREQHDIVLRLGRAADAILPARFGALVDESELQRVLRVRRAALRNAFQAVRGKEQMTIRVFGRPVPSRAARTTGSGTDYLRTRAESVRAHVPPVASAIRRALGTLVSAERVDRGRGNILVTLNHLVDRGRASRYRSVVEAAVEQCDVPPPVVISGPWPPFAFAPDLWSSEVGVQTS
jgi:Gas vesicle synthesis protein GvpL/GvpF